MKSTFPFITFLFACLSLQATGPWTEYGEIAPAEGTPAKTATDYVILANKKDFESCRDHMTAEYEAWLERLGGLESNLEVFYNANLQKRFGWREINAGGTAIVWVRIYSVERGREVNVALNLTQTDSGWKLTI